MAFANSFVFNIARGRVNYYSGLVGTGNAALVLVLLEDAGLEAIATIRDHDTVAAILAGTSNEQTTMGRKTVTVATVAVDDTNNLQYSDFADQTWVAATGNSTGGLVISFDPDTTAGTDSDLIPLVGVPFGVTPAGANVTYSLNAQGFYVARDCA